MTYIDGGKNGNSEDAKDWSENNENAFLSILYGWVKKDLNSTHIFKPNDWLWWAISSLGKDMELKN